MKFNTAKFYSLFTGAILFLLGFLGFAFRGVLDLPDAYLFFALILGFWGIILGVSTKE